MRDAIESATFRSVAPGSAVDVDQDGQWFVIDSLFWQRQVQCLTRVVGGCVGEVFEDPEVLGAGYLPPLLPRATSHEVQVLLERDEVIFVLVDAFEIASVAFWNFCTGQFAIFVFVPLFEKSIRLNLTGSRPGHREASQDGESGLVLG